MPCPAETPDGHETTVRPAALLRAARRNGEHYRRDRDLAAVLGTVPQPCDALMQLVDVEAQLNRDRAARRPGYCDARHVLVLTALLGETRLTARLGL